MYCRPLQCMTAPPRSSFWTLLPSEPSRYPFRSPLPFIDSFFSIFPLLFCFFYFFDFLFLVYSLLSSLFSSPPFSCSILSFSSTPFLSSPPIFSCSPYKMYASYMNTLYVWITSCTAVVAGWAREDLNPCGTLRTAHHWWERVWLQHLLPSGTQCLLVRSTIIVESADSIIL